MNPARIKEESGYSGEENKWFIMTFVTIVVLSCPMT